MAAGCLVVLGVVLVLVLRGGSGPGEREITQGGGAYVPPGEPGGTAFSAGSSTSATRESEIGFLDIPVVMTERVHQESFDGPVTARLSPDGRSYLVGGTLQRAGRKYIGFRVYDIQGSVLWEHVFASANYRSGDVRYLAGGQYIGAVAVDYNSDGEVHVLASGGQYVYNGETDGWSRPIMSDGGSWLAVVNEKLWNIRVEGIRSPSSIWSIGVKTGTTACFIGDGPQLLVNEAGRATLYGEGGRRLWSVDVPGGGRWNAVPSPDGRYIAVTTEDPDSTVYLYATADGSLVWSQFLVVGGDKHPAFSPDGSDLCVYDIGERAAVYMMDVATGEIKWRFYLQGHEGSVLTLDNLQFSASGKRMLVDVTETTETPDNYVFRHYLLLMTREGRAVWVSALGAGVDVQMNAVAGLALIATNNMTDIYGEISNTVTVVSFTVDDSTPGEAGGN